MTLNCHEACKETRQLRVISILVQALGGQTKKAARKGPQHEYHTTVFCRLSTDNRPHRLDSPF